MTKFGLPSAKTVIHITPFVCQHIFYEYGGPQIATEPLPFPVQNITTDQSGLATMAISFTTPDPSNARRFIDGQLYPYLYWAESNPIDPEQTCNGRNSLYLLNSYFIIRVFDSHTYRDPPTWNEDVYPIFKKYANLYPVMTFNYVDLGNYYEVIKHCFHINMTMQLSISHPNHMPVTRDLSKDKRDMILKWLEDPCPGDASVTAKPSDCLRNRARHHTNLPHSAGYHQRQLQYRSTRYLPTDPYSRNVAFGPCCEPLECSRWRTCAVF